MVVRECLIALHHRELGVVLAVDSLVAEVLADFVDALQATDDQPLEVQFVRDPQVEILIERVVMRDERACRRAAI